MFLKMKEERKHQQQTEKVQIRQLKKKNALQMFIVVIATSSSRLVWYLNI